MFKILLFACFAVALGASVQKRESPETIKCNENLSPGGEKNENLETEKNCQESSVPKTKDEDEETRIESNLEANLDSVEKREAPETTECNGREDLHDHKEEKITKSEDNRPVTLGGEKNENLVTEKNCEESFDLNTKDEETEDKINCEGNPKSVQKREALEKKTSNDGENLNGHKQENITRSEDKKPATVDGEKNENFEIDEICQESSDIITNDEETEDESDDEESSESIQKREAPESEEREIGNTHHHHENDEDDRNSEAEEHNEDYLKKEKSNDNDETEDKNNGEVPSNLIYTYFIPLDVPEMYLYPPVSWMYPEEY